MNLEKISDKSLLTNTENLVKNEKNYTIKVLQHLAEIDRRKLFVELGFSSLFSYCQNHLHYSEPESAIRVNAARLIKTSQLAENKIEKQELSLSTASDLFSQMKKYAKQNKKKLNKDEQEKLIEKVSNCSAREAKKFIQTKLNLLPITKTEVQLKAETLKRIEKLKTKLGVYDLDQLLNLLMDQKEDEIIETKVTQKTVKADCTLTSKSNSSRYVPIKTKRELLKRANYCCEFVNENGVKCQAALNLQVEHINPFSVSQNHQLSNLKILCQQHNLYNGIKFFGVDKMNSYLRN